MEPPSARTQPQLARRDANTGSEPGRLLALPTALENAVFDFVAFTEAFRLRALCKDACELLRRVWARKEAVRLVAEGPRHSPAWTTDRRGRNTRQKNAVWEMAARCELVSTLVVDERTYSEGHWYALVCKHSHHIRRIDLRAKPNNSPLLAYTLGRCSALESLFFGEDVLEPRDCAALAVVLPRSCPRLRALSWSADDGEVLAKLADAGVLLERLAWRGVWSARLALQVARHPLRVLDLSCFAAPADDDDDDDDGDATGVDGLGGAPTEDDGGATLEFDALRAMVWALRPSLRDLTLWWGSTTGTLPLWRGLERLSVEGGPRGSEKPAKPAIAFAVSQAGDGDTLRSLRAILGAEDAGNWDWPTLAARMPALTELECDSPALVSLLESAPPPPPLPPPPSPLSHTVVPSTTAPVASSATVSVAAVANDSTRAVVVRLWPKLLHLACRGPLSLDAVLAAWPELESLDVQSHSYEQTTKAETTAATTRSAVATAVAAPMAAPALPVRAHKCLTTLRLHVLNPPPRAWVLPRLRSFTFAAYAVGADGHDLAVQWREFKAYLFAAADRLSDCTLHLADDASKSTELPAEHNEVADDDATVVAGLPAELPLLSRVSVSAGRWQGAHKPEVCALLRRARAVESVWLRGLSSADIARICTLGDCGRAGGVFSRLTWFSCSEVLPESVYRCLLHTAPGVA